MKKERKDSGGCDEFTLERKWRRKGFNWSDKREKKGIASDANTWFYNSVDEDSWTSAQIRVMYCCTVIDSLAFYGNYLIVLRNSCRFLTLYSNQFILFNLHEKDVHMIQKCIGYIPHCITSCGIIIVCNRLHLHSSMAVGWESRGRMCKKDSACLTISQLASFYAKVHAQISRIYWLFWSSVNAYRVLPILL